MTGQMREREITIIGGGLGGTMAALLFAARNYVVTLIEKQWDPRRQSDSSGRSINMTLSIRGLRVLEEAGLLEMVKPLTTKLRARAVHAFDGTVTIQPYGHRDGEYLYSIKRHDLHALLLDVAECQSNIRLLFNHRLTRLNKRTRTLTLTDLATDVQKVLEANTVIGADGTFSTVRRQMQLGERADFHQEFMNWGYKELEIPPGPRGATVLDKHFLHVWPRQNGLLIALPNPDGSFTCTCVLPFEGRDSLSTLDSDLRVLRFFTEQFPDVVSLIPSLSRDFLDNPPGYFVTNRTSMWHYKDLVVLIGDAAHSVVPFYGQGMNAAFEDALLLVRSFEEHPLDREAAFIAFEVARKRNTDVLAELSIQNFHELHDGVSSLWYKAQYSADLLLTQLFPDFWEPLYSLIAHSTVPYAEALERYQRRRRIARYLGLDLLEYLLLLFHLCRHQQKRLKQY